MDLYLRKSQPIEAVKFEGGDLQAAEIDSWLDLWGDVKYVGERFVPSTDPQYIDNDVLIPVIQFPEHLILVTDVGNFHVPLNSWIVKEAEGALSILNDASFNNIYVRIESNE